MKSTIYLRYFIPFVLILLLVPLTTRAQCDVFKSEMESVHIYLLQASQLLDSLEINAETAAFAGEFKTARENSAKVEFLMGQAVTAIDESVKVASEAQYYSEICGITEVKSYAIDSENYVTDAFEHIDEAYANAKKAKVAKTLGDLQYYMRKAQVAGRAAQDSADNAALASSTSYYSCHHLDTAVMESDK